MVNLVYNFEDSLRSCVVLLQNNFARLSDYAGNRETPASKFSETSDEYQYIKKCLDETKENIMELNSEYSCLNRHYSKLLENNSAKEFLNYAKFQEPLRLKFIKTIIECKRVNKYLDMIQNGVPITISNEDSSPSPRKKFRAAYKDVKSNAKSNFASVSKADTSPTKLHNSKDDPHLKNNNYEVNMNEVNESVSEKEEISPALFPIFSEVDMTGMVEPSYSSLNNDVPEAEEECDTTVQVEEFDTATSSESEPDEPVQPQPEEVSNQKPPYVCNICSKIFQRRDKLRRHEFLHSGMKPFACPKCDASFARKDYVRSHLRSRHNYKPEVNATVFECDICDKRFRSSQTLTFHKRTHEASLKICTLCGKSFNQRNRLVDHMAKKHSISIERAERIQYRCSHCSESYQSIDNFFKHLKQSHNK